MEIPKSNRLPVKVLDTPRDDNKLYGIENGLLKEVVKTDYVVFGEFTESERNLLVVPPGEVWKIYNSTTNKFEHWNGTEWVYTYVDTTLNDAEVKIAYENNANTNAFTDDHKTKLENIESDKNYVHTQGLPSSTWVINHGMNKYPSVIVLDSTGSRVMGNEIYVDLNTVRLEFGAAFSGQASLN